MTRKENIRAILECYFTGFKDVMIDSACERICELEQEPTAEKSVLDMTELEKALLHIKTRADAWAVKAIKDALSQEPCEIIHGSTYGGVSWGGTYKLQEPCTDAVSRDAVLSKIKEVCFSEEWTQFRLDKGSNGQRDFLINFIEKLPSVTPKPIECDDAISRKDAEQMFRNIRSHLKPQDYKSAEEFNTRDLMLLNAEQMIHALPSVTQKSETVTEFADRCRECGAKYGKYRKEAKRWKNKWLKSQKSGKWIKKEDDTCWWYVCSECEQEPLKNRWNDDDVLSTFCPNCGARMAESEE